MAWYPYAVRKPIAPGPNDPKIAPTAVVLHVAATTGDSLFQWFNGPSGGVESHFYVRLSGVVEQYRDTAYQADAQMAYARDQISIETAGMASGTWNADQLAALRKLLAWISSTHNIPLTLNTSETNPRGVAWHSQFHSWTGDSRTCPGVERIPQIPSLIQEDDDMAMSADDRAWLEGRLKAYFLWVDKRLAQVEDVKLDALSTAVKALAEGQDETVRAAVLAALSAQYDATVTLTEKDATP